MDAKMVQQADGGAILSVKVVPGASRDRIVGVLGEALKVAVSKPPQGGAANAAVVALLASALGLPANQVLVHRGHSNPRKQVFIRGMTARQLEARLQTLLKG
jgi:uncharacterized protein (TIGR00251 family)